MPSTNSNPNNKTISFYFTDLKIEKKFTNKSQNWGANKKTMDNINKTNKSPQTLRLIEKQQITKPESLWCKLDCNLNGRVWVPRPPNKRGRNEVVPIDLELMFRDNEKNEWGGGYFEVNEFRASSSTERIKQEPENVSSTKDSDTSEAIGKIPHC